LKSQQQNNVQPENANNQYAKPHDEVAPLFSITGKDCEDSEPITLDFYPAESQYFNMEGNLLRFHLGHNKPGYLVTNPSGNFDLAPAEQQQLDLEPDSTYRITGRIAIEEAASLVFWVFEYRKNITANKTSYPCPDGKVSAVFRTGHGFSRVAFGIRVAGEGVIDIASSELYLDSGSAAEQAYEAQQKAAEQKCRAEENKKNLMQLEDFMRLQHYMGSNFIMPDMHSWPISPDMGVLLIRQIEAEQYDAVIEFGSGVSTVVIAKALSRCCNNDIKQPLFLSFDHLEKYYNQTAEYLKRARLNTFVQLKLAPLQPYKGPDGNEYNYYSCAENLKNFKIKLDDNLDGRMPRILAMIDGPPGKTCPHARYPALPLLYSVFEGHCELNLLMDDYVRDDEREIVKKWVEWLQQKGIQFSTEEFLTMEKQACLIRIESSES
jgi:hypothetical protein